MDINFAHLASHTNKHFSTAVCERRLCFFVKVSTGRGTVGSARCLGRRGREFEPHRPDIQVA